MKDMLLPVESVQERDIDFLLIEEFLASRRFVDYFTKTLELPDCDIIVDVQRSVNDFGLGETDVFVDYLHGNAHIGVLIENKLDAIFQPQQAARYRSRARKYETEGRFKSTYEVLVAPAQYIARQNYFSRVISYEQLIEYFQKADLGARGEFKVKLLTIAAEKLRRGYVAVNSEPNQSFWRSYYQYLAVELPMVTMKQVATVPVGSDWIDLSLDSRRFVHKLKKGQIDFVALKDVEAQLLRKNFGGRAKQLAFTSGPVLRVQTISLDRLREFQAQIVEVQQCMDDIRTAVSILRGAN